MSNELLINEVFGYPAERKGEGDADELHHQQRADQGGLVKADLRAVDGGHLNDGADALISIVA